MKYYRIGIILMGIALSGGDVTAQTHPSLCKNIRHKKTDGSTYVSSDYGETWSKLGIQDFLSQILTSDKFHNIPNVASLPSHPPSSLIWQNSYTSDDFTNPLIVPQAKYETEDGATIIGGDVGYVKYFLKIDASGNEIKRTHYGSIDTAIDIAVADKLANNSGFSFFGKRKNFFTAIYGFFCQIITDNDLNILACQYTDSLNTLFPDGYSSFIKSHNGFHTTSMNSGKYDSIFVSKIDHSGIIQWTRPYSIETNLNASANSLLETHDANLVIAVTRTHPLDSIKNISDCLLLKCDSIGNVLWKKKIQWNTSFSISSTIETSEGNIFLVGKVFDGISKENVFTALISSGGDILWENTFGIDSRTYITPNCVALDTKGNFIIGGAAGDYHASVVNKSSLNWDMYLAKIDPQGKPLWQYSWGVDSLKDVIYNVSISHDNKIVVLGETGAPLFPDFGGSMYLAKLDDAQASVPASNVANENFITLYPNPCTTFLNIDCSNISEKIQKAEIIGLMGNSIASLAVNNSNSVMKYNAENLPAGTYFLKVSTASHIISKPFIVVK